MAQAYCSYTDRHVVVSCYNTDGQCPCLNCTKNPRICDEEHCRILREQHCIVPRGTVFTGINGEQTMFGVPTRTPLKGKKDISYACLNCLAVNER